jgi:DNA polymerase-3 subunit beta
MSRNYLTGICLHDLGSSLAAVAADGIRLCRTITKAGPFSPDRSLIVPGAAAKTIIRLLTGIEDTVVLRRSATLFQVEAPSFSFVTRIIDGIFPSYTQMFPAASSHVVTVDRNALLESIARFKAVADPLARSPSVSLSWDADGLHLISDGNSADSIPAEVEGEGSTKIQIRYLAELLAQLAGGSVTLAANDPRSEIVVTSPGDDDFVAVQMPLVR